MRRPHAIWRVMPSISLDSDTADRMLGGDVRPSDAPPGYERLCELFDALRDTSGQLDGFGIAPAQRTPTRPRSIGLARGMRRSTVAFAVALGLTGGAAFAAGLPQTASRTASNVLDKLGVSVPGWDRQSPPPENGTTSISPAGKEREPSRTTTPKGEKKGAKGSPAASDGKSKTGKSTAGENPGRGFGRGGRHGGSPPGHADKRGRGHGKAGQPGVRNHGQSAEHGNGPKGKVNPAGGNKHANPGGGTNRPPAHKNYKEN
ncbi:MAG: hypothetical protein QOF68_1948 [Gaiellales bacterium]|nr:hypothetical protein [Gaiellales bacterium]